jgi:hypothetical protein
MVVRWPRHVPAGEVEMALCRVRLLPTVGAAAGYPNIKDELLQKK